MTSPESTVTEVGVFSARRYRLTNTHSRVTVLHPATVWLYWLGPRFQVEMSYPPGHAATVQWVDTTPVGEWMSVQCWMPHRPSPGASSLGWNVLEVDAAMQLAATGMFVGACRAEFGPDFTMACSPPPEVETAGELAD